MKKRIMNKIFRLSLIMIIAICVIGIAGCKKNNNPPVHETICPGCKKTDVVHEKCTTCGGYTCVGNHNHVQIVCPGCKKEGISHPTCSICKGYICVGNHDHTSQIEPISIEITNSTQIKSGQTIELSAQVTGSTNTEVLWEVVSGSEYVTIQDNQLVANEVTSDQEIEIKVTSVADKNISKTKKFTIIAKPVLTQEMLNTLNVDKIGFDGYLKIDLYTIGFFEEFYSTYTSVVKTAMDGTNWYAEYLNADTGTKNYIYYKNNNGIACQVGVNLMNEELYSPQLDDNGLKVTWVESGLYNNFKGLKLSDFTFDEETWRYTYTGSDSKFITRVSASANPYDFVPVSLSLIIEDGELMGVKIIGEDSYTVAQGYRASQELSVVINAEQNIDVPTVTKYQHDPIHDALNEAINNMKALNSYTLDFEKYESVYGSSPTASGYQETIMNNICLFTPYEVTVINGNEVHTPIESSRYGFKKISDMLYNTFTKQSSGYVAARAYEKEFSNAKPTFGFVGEIFTSYYQDEENGTTTYYVNELMCNVATTLYHDISNDYNLYGIYATNMTLTGAETFSPYVTIKDGYITEACFYYNMGSLYGVVELKYSDFNTATIPENETIEFETRQVPTSWSELSITVTSEVGSTNDDVEVNALEYLQQFFEGIDNIEEKMPFFGNPLGDTYGLGMTTIYIPKETKVAKNAIMFFYDVPLDIDYSITSSLEAIKAYLLDLGFTKNEFDEFEKDGICVAPIDSSLDLQIYVWQK